jgi:hypothetical protein
MDHRATGDLDAAGIAGRCFPDGLIGILQLRLNNFIMARKPHLQYQFGHLH